MLMLQRVLDYVCHKLKVLPIKERLRTKGWFDGMQKTKSEMCSLDFY